MNKQKLIAAGITALACFAFFVMVLTMYNDITVTREDLRVRQAVLKERTDLLSQVDKWDEQYQQYSEQISKLDILLPEKKQIDQIISSLQAISSQTGLNLTEMNVAEFTSQTQTGYKSSVVSAQLTGTYPQFVNFLTYVEQSLRIYDVNNIVIAESTGIQKNALNFQVKIYTNSIK